MLFLLGLFSVSPPPAPAPCELCGTWTSLSAMKMMVLLPPDQARFYDLLLGGEVRMGFAKAGRWTVSGSAITINGEVYASKGEELHSESSGWGRVGELPGGSEVSTWTAAWESKDLEAYSALYHPDFKAKDQDRSAWLKDKEGKFARAGCIELEVADVRFEGLTATFQQTYVSDTWCDVGEKTLRFELGLMGWAILSEEQPEAKPCQRRCTPG